MARDLIRRSDAIRIIDELLERMTEDGCLTVIGDERVKELKQDIENLPAVQPEPPWVPCSKRLPQYHEDVLISFLEGFVIDASREKWEMSRDVWMTDNGVTLNLNDANAWMPLPDPYEGEEDIPEVL